jgi:O-acetyl-ADP-ribose deacetylase (regulator of RNase III)
MAPTLRAVQADIATLNVDPIVNAAMKHSFLKRCG